VQSPTSREQENIFTVLATQYLDKRERIFNVFVWLAVFFCLSCFVLCYVGISSLVKQNTTLEKFVEHETMMSELRNQREIEKAKLDSLATKKYLEQVKHYESLPDYKGN
jgi:hypothetical protein